MRRWSRPERKKMMARMMIIRRTLGLMLSLTTLLFEVLDPMKRLLFGGGGKRVGALSCNKVLVLPIV